MSVRPTWSPIQLSLCLFFEWSIELSVCFDACICPILIAPWVAFNSGFLHVWPNGLDGFYLFPSRIRNIKWFCRLHFRENKGSFRFCGLWPRLIVNNPCCSSSQMTNVCVCVCVCHVRPSFSSFMCAYLSRFDVISFITSAVSCLCYAIENPDKYTPDFSLEKHTHFSHRHHVLCTMHRLWATQTYTDHI